MLTKHVVKRSTILKVEYSKLTLGQKAAFEIVQQHFTLLCFLWDTVRTMAFVGQAAFHVDD